MEIQQVNLGQVAFNPKGSWNADVTYKRLNVVYYKGRSYYAKQENTNQPPSMDSDFWGLMVDGGDVTNNPDEEDVTSMMDEDGKSVIKFADRAYDPDRFSGKGYKILRKNMQNVRLAVVTINVTKAPTADGELSITINNIDTHIALSATEQNTTALTAQAIADALTTEHEDYDVTVSDSTVTLIRKFGEDVPASAHDVAATGMELTVEDSVKTVRRNLITPIMISKPNTIYEIRYDFDLNGGEIQVPENCTLKFEGGSLNNGKINLNFCNIIKGRITAFPTSSPANNLFKVSDFCISKNSKASYNNEMLQCMIDLKAKIFIDVNERITFDEPLYNIQNDFYGIYDIKPVSDTDLNDCILYFPKSKGIVCNVLATRLKISNLIIKSLEDSVSISNSYILFFENLNVYSQRGSCFVSKPSPYTFQTKFSNILVYCKDGKYGFNSFNGNTTAFEDITILKCGVSAFNNCCGYFNRINGCWGDTPHFMTANKTTEDETDNYSVMIFLNQCNIESYENTPIDFGGSLFKNVTLKLINTTIYNYKENGKYTHPLITAHSLKLHNTSVSCKYDENEYEKDIYPIIINKTSPYNASSIETTMRIDVYDYNFNKLLVFERNRLTRENVSSYKQDVFNERLSTYNNYKFEKLFLTRCFFRKKEIVYPSEVDRLQINLLEGQNFSISAENDTEDTKIVQLSGQYVANNPINYGKLGKGLDFITIYNNCTKSKLKVYGTNVFLNYAIINPDESCSFVNLNGVYYLYSVNGFLTMNYQNTVNISSTVQESNDGLLFFNSKIKKVAYSCNGEWKDLKENPIETKYYGITSSRPSNVIVGTCYFDITIQKPIFWNGEKWLDSDGNSPDVQRKGTSSDRPTSINIGFIYKDTDLDKLIVWDGNKWINLDGTALE